MMESRRECELLRPLLVALIYDEYHPEIPRLLSHLEDCACCRAEEIELEDTRRWVDCSSETVAAGLLETCGGNSAAHGSDEGKGRSRFYRVRDGLVGVAAALLVIWLLLGVSSDRTVGLPGALDGLRGRALSVDTPGTLEGDELDRRLETIDGEVGRLLEDGEDPW